MKKLIITIAALMALATTAFAANEVTVTEAGNFHIYYNDVEKGFTDVNGTVVRPIVLEGTTYLPVRAASELVGLSASWNGETSTVTLTAGSGTGCVTTAPAPIAQRAVSATIADNFTIIYNSTKQSFADANGKVVYPVVKDGTTYLPIRALCSMLNIPVEWDGTTSSIYLGTHTVAPIPAKSVDLSTPDKAWTEVLPTSIESYRVYEVDTTGYNYLRLTATAPMDGGYSFLYDNMEAAVSGNGSIGLGSFHDKNSNWHSKTFNEVVFDVSDYGVVYLKLDEYVPSETAAPTAVTATLEPAAVVPAYSIPSGATALTDANTTFDSRENAGDTVYSNGQFIRHNKFLWDGADSINFQNAGYSTITFTVTTKSMEMCVAVFQPTATGSIDVLDVKQKANTTKTYTADISNLSTVAVSTWNADYCDSIITNMYVK